MLLCHCTIVTTVIPWLTRCPWQQKDRIKRNLRYSSHGIDKKIVRKIHLTLLLLYYKTVLWEFILHFLVNHVLRIRTLRNRVSWGMTVIQKYEGQKVLVFIELNLIFDSDALCEMKVLQKISFSCYDNILACTKF